VTDFARGVELELSLARNGHGALRCRHEAVGVILEEFEEFKQEAFLKKPDATKMCRELIQIAAMCQRAAEDLGYIDKAMTYG